MDLDKRAAYNIHRNVIYRDGGAIGLGRSMPLTSLWPLGSPLDTGGSVEMDGEAYEAKTGGDVLAIAHNGNVSKRS